MNKVKKRLLKEIDDRDKNANDRIEKTYKQYIKHTLHALELFKNGIRWKDIKD